MDNDKLRDSARGDKRVLHLLESAYGWGPWTFHSTCGRAIARMMWDLPVNFTEEPNDVTCKLCRRSC